MPIRTNRSMVGFLFRCQAFCFDQDQSTPIRAFALFSHFRGNFEPAPHSFRGKHPVNHAAERRRVSLAHLVRQELAPCAAALNTVLAADAAQPVAFVLHELVTNAAKYGALPIRRGTQACNGINGRRTRPGSVGARLERDRRAAGHRLRSHQATVPVSSKTSSTTSRRR